MEFSIPARRTYYDDPAVHRRISEFFGGPLPDEATAVYFAAGTDEASHHRDRLPLEDVQSWMRHGAELNRSLWDQNALIVHLDLEYVNFDDAAYSFLEPGRAFQIQEPVVAAVQEFLGSFGIVPLHVLTGRGHHFVWQIDQKSKAFGRLAKLGHLSASLRRLYSTECSPTGELVSPQLGSAFAGLGLVIEFSAHQVKARAALHCEVPVELGAIETGGASHGRETIALDITEYADPLCSRVTRAPFSLYLKPQQSHLDLEHGHAPGIAPLFVVPMAGMSVAKALEVRHDPRAVARLAGNASAVIPDASEAMDRVIDAYERSPLATFHRQYYAEQHDAPALWPETYDRTDLEQLPTCARLILQNPNDLLLRPGCVQRVVLVLLSSGWHPRHIAGLIRSKYERDFGWGEQWAGFDPATRADFYGRLFSGLFFMGVDDLASFSCQAAQASGLCLAEDCTQNLQQFRNALPVRQLEGI